MTGRAHVGVETSAGPATNGTANLTVAVTNRYPGRETLGGGDLNPGQRAARIFLEVSCDAAVRLRRPVDCG